MPLLEIDPVVSIVTDKWILLVILIDPQILKELFNFHGKLLRCLSIKRNILSVMPLDSLPVELLTLNKFIGWFFRPCHHQALLHIYRHTGVRKGVRSDNTAYRSKQVKIKLQKVIFQGGLNSAAVHPREVMHENIRVSANSFILVHNHPSGDETPSDNDIRFTKRMFEVGKLMGIDLLDHIIIGDQSYWSAAESNII